MSLKHIVWVLEHSEAREGARLVMIVLAEHANDHDTAYPSVQTIASQTRLSERAVQYALRKLEAEGEVEPDGKSRYGTTIYRLMRGCKDCGGAISDTKGVQSSTAQTAPEPTPLFEPTTQPSAREKELQELADHFRARFPKKRFKLDEKHTKTLADALNVCPLEECKRAVDGLAADEYLNEHGFTDIHYALGAKGKQTIEDRVAYMAAKAPADAVSAALAHVPSGAREMVRTRQRQVEDMLLNPGDRTLLARGEGSVTYLRETWGLRAHLDDGGAVVWVEGVVGGVQ